MVPVAAALQQGAMKDRGQGYRGGYWVVEEEESEEQMQ